MTQLGQRRISYQATLNRIFVHDLDPLPYWHQENLLMIGDAALAPLPTSGQGACQALEDAWHLPQLLAEQEVLENVLAAFYQRRISKASAAQHTGRQMAQHIFDASAEPAEPKAISAEQLSQFGCKGYSCCQ